MSNQFELYYWPIPFRGQPIRFVLAHVGATWSEVGFEELVAFKDRDIADKPYPFLAPPVLHDLETDSWLSQMPAVMMYLGRRYDLLRDEDQSLRIVCDASDVLLEVTRYHGAEMWDEASWAEFRDHRLPLWMRLHEALVLRLGADAEGGWLFGADGPGLADLALAGLWHTMVDRVTPLRPVLHAHAPTVEALVDRVAATPAIAKLREEWADSGWRYCAGQIEESLFAVAGDG